MLTICLDFDGVLHSYTSGWTGVDNVADKPVLGAQEFCRTLLDRNYKIVVLSSRFKTEGRGDINSEAGIKAVEEWLTKHRFPSKIKLTATKPAASLYIDDRGLRFEGRFDNMLAFLDLYPQPSSWVKR